MTDEKIVADIIAEEIAAIFKCKNCGSPNFEYVDYGITGKYTCLACGVVYDTKECGEQTKEQANAYLAGIIWVCDGCGRKYRKYLCSNWNQQGSLCQECFKSKSGMEAKDIMFGIMTASSYT